MGKKQIIISLLLPFVVLIVIPVFLLIFSTEISSLFNLNPILIVLSVIVLICGFFLFLRCILIFHRKGLGTLMPISQIQTKKLVIKGPYKYVRNPMIIGVIIMLLGESLLFDSLAIFIFSLAFFILNIIYIPLFEEKGLLKRFGEEFARYKKQVPAWIPKLKLSKYNRDKNLD